MIAWMITVKGGGPEHAISDPRAHIMEDCVPAALFFCEEDAEVSYDAIDIDDQITFEIIKVKVSPVVPIYRDAED